LIERSTGTHATAARLLVWQRACRQKIQAAGLIDGLQRPGNACVESFDAKV
jgi:hypothetical protein